MTWEEQALEVSVAQPAVVEDQVGMPWSQSQARASQWDDSQLNRQRSWVQVGVDFAATVGAEGLRSRLLVQPCRCC